MSVIKVVNQESEKVFMSTGIIQPPKHLPVSIGREILIEKGHFKVGRVDYINFSLPQSSERLRKVALGRSVFELRRIKTGPSLSVPSKVLCYG